jgi:hypothetical protein
VTLSTTSERAIEYAAKSTNETVLLLPPPLPDESNVPLSARADHPHHPHHQHQHQHSHPPPPPPQQQQQQQSQQNVVATYER